MGRDPDYLAFVRAATSGPAQPRGTYEQERLELRGVMAAVPRTPVGSVTDHPVTLPGGRVMDARLYRPVRPVRAACLVYVHGGGWSVGDVESWDPVVRTLVAASGLAMLSIEQRQAPEHPYPAALDDTVGAVRWLRQHGRDLGVEATAVGVAGDSSGGNVAAAAALRLRDEGDAPLLLQLLVYPVLDVLHRPVDLVDPDGVDWRRDDPGVVYDPYVGQADAASGYLSPGLAADLAGLPPTVIATAEHDRLRPEAERFAARLRASGVPVELVSGDGLDHAFVAWVSYARRPREAVAEIGAATNRMVTLTR